MKKLSYFLCILLVTLPFFIFFCNLIEVKNIDIIWWSINLFIGYSGYLVLIYKLFFKKGISFNLEKILFLIFIVLIIITTVINKGSYIGDDYRHDGLLTFLSYIGIFIHATNIKKEDIYKLFKIFSITAFFLSLVCLLDNQFNLYLNFNNYKYSSIFYNPNHFAYYLTISLILVINLFLNENNKIKNIINYIIFIVIFCVFILNNTFGSFLGFLLAFVILFIMFVIRKKDLLKLFILLFTIIILSLDVSNNRGVIVINNFKSLFGDIETLSVETEESKLVKVGNRYILWKYGIEMIKERPLLGYGLDNLWDKYRSYGINEDRPHNEFIQIGASSGIITLSTYILFLVLIVIKGLKQDKINILLSITVIGYLGSSFFGNTMFYTTPYFYLMVGLLVLLNSKQKDA